MHLLFYKRVNIAEDCIVNLRAATTKPRMYSLANSPALPSYRISKCPAQLAPHSHPPAARNNGPQRPPLSMHVNVGTRGLHAPVLLIRGDPTRRTDGASPGEQTRRRLLLVSASTQATRPSSARAPPHTSAAPCLRGLPPPCMRAHAHLTRSRTEGRCGYAY